MRHEGTEPETPATMNHCNLVDEWQRATMYATQTQALVSPLYCCVR